MSTVSLVHTGEQYQRTALCRARYSTYKNTLHITVQQLKNKDNTYARNLIGFTVTTNIKRSFKVPTDAGNYMYRVKGVSPRTRETLDYFLRGSWVFIFLRFRRVYCASALSTVSVFPPGDVRGQEPLSCCLQGFWACFHFPRKERNVKTFNWTIVTWRYLGLIYIYFSSPLPNRYFGA